MNGEVPEDDSHPVLPWLTQKRRAWFYRLALAAATLLAVFGVVQESEALAVVGFISVFLGNTMAVAYTSGQDPS